MPVWQVSSSENSVGLVSPRRVCVSSRLRRVLAGRSIRRCARHLQAAHVGQRAALGVFGIGQQRGGGGVRVGQVLRAPGGQAGGLQLFEQLALAQGASKAQAGRTTGHRRLAPAGQRGPLALQFCSVARRRA
jgi:hypothetical protein